MGRKWNNIKMKKAAQDRTRSLSYTKVLQEVTIAVKQGGAEADSNFRLKVALEKAKKNNVPKDNIDRAIQKGLGGDQSDWQEVNYEGYGPEGVGVWVEAATDNVTRTISNVRNFFKKAGGSIGKEGSLQFVFERKAVFNLKEEGQDVDELTLELIDFGAEDVEAEDGFITITAEVESYGTLYNKLEEMGIELEESGLERIPLNEKAVTSKENYDAILKLIEKLEDDEDVQKVYHNMEFNEDWN